MNSKKKNNRPSKYLIIMSIVLSALCIVLTVFDVLHCREAGLHQVCEEKKHYLSVMTESCELDTDALIAYIEEEYPTSASDYCFVAVEDELVFLRDENRTKNLKETGMEEYFGTLDTNIELVELNGADWYVICHEEENESGALTVGICISEDYLIAGGDFDILLRNSVLYMVLFSVSFIVSVIFLAHREKENADMESQLTEQLSENRRLIERLGERLEAQSSMDYERENGFSSRAVIEQILSKMTSEQKSKSYKVRIQLEETDSRTIVNYSVLLERMKVNRSICCLWKDGEFLVLLLNTDEVGANNYVKQFLLQYQKMFQKDARDIHISIEKIYSGEQR